MYRLMLTFVLVAAVDGAQAADRSGIPDCDAAPYGQLCRCDLETIRPLQGAIGMAEVKSKQKDIEDEPVREHMNLAEDPIKLVRGPGGELYITDHHHGGRAWLEYQAKTNQGHHAFCEVSKLAGDAATQAEFEQQLDQQRLVHLEDKNGRRIAFADLPRTLGQMPDDPYRSLAAMLRTDKPVAWCRTGQVEFAEFEWADYLRGVVDGVDPLSDKGLKRAREAALSSSAPANRVAHPTNDFKCPKS